MRTTLVDEIQRAALDALAAGYQPIPVPYRSKNPARYGWQDERRVLEDGLYDFCEGENIGNLNGEPSGGLVDVDLDAEEAIGAASEFLSETLMIHGRDSKPRSHFWYISDPSPKTRQWADVNGNMLVELRSTGTQTVIPPSMHPEGERLEWYANGKPGQVNPDHLVSACTWIAISSLLARHWPNVGARHHVANAMAGFLIRKGLDVALIVKIVTTSAKVANDDEWIERGNTAEDTAKRFMNGTPVTGGPSAAELLIDGDLVLNKIVTWLRDIGFSLDENSNPTSDFSNTRAKVGLERLRAIDLQSPENEIGRTLDFLDLFDSDYQVFVKGWSHAVVGFPKVGKTEFISHLVSQWNKKGCCQSATMGQIGTRENYCYGEPALSFLTVRL